MARRASIGEIVAIEGAVLEELARELRAEGLDEYARRIMSALSELEDDGLSDLEKVRRVVVGLRPIDYALAEAGLDFHKGLRQIRRRLAFEADKLLEDTQKLSTGEYSAVDHGD